MDNSHNGFDGKGMIKKINWNTVAWIAIAVLLTWQINSCFKKTPPNEELIIAREKAKAIEEKRISDSTLNAEKIKAKDLEIAYLKDKDTVFVNKLVTNDKKIKASNDRVNSLTDAELERAYSTY